MSDDDKSLNKDIKISFNPRKRTNLRRRNQSDDEDEVANTQDTT